MFTRFSMLFITEVPISDSNRKCKFDISMENICVLQLHPFVSISNCLIRSFPIFITQQLNVPQLHRQKAKRLPFWAFPPLSRTQSEFEDVYGEHKMKFQFPELIFVRNLVSKQIETKISHRMSENSICMANKSQLSPTVYARRKQNKRQTTTFC